ncbi:hypothetical protein SCHPADRAFT_884523 [Schizopora paradoxa]|uniref:Uncharacterized protein n=1 Tax=Schizopora paradoxa TaxID=27342 RepID=A0A0H2S9G2_9AGAM|nr:hypothetical protein SCHPADRAFT_884523 [Schizopora paradoxa]
MPPFWARKSSSNTSAATPNLNAEWQQQILGIKVQYAKGLGCYAMETSYFSITLSDDIAYEVVRQTVCPISPYDPASRTGQLTKKEQKTIKSTCCFYLTSVLEALTIDSKVPGSSFLSEVRVAQQPDRVSYSVTRKDQYNPTYRAISRGAIVFIVDVYSKNRKEVTERRYQSYNYIAPESLAIIGSASTIYEIQREDEKVMLLDVFYLATNGHEFRVDYEKLEQAALHPILHPDIHVTEPQFDKMIEEANEDLKLARDAILQSPLRACFQGDFEIFKM